MICHGKSLSSGHWITNYALCNPGKTVQGMVGRMKSEEDHERLIAINGREPIVTYVNYLAHHFAGGTEE